MQCGAAAILLTRSSCSEVQGNQIALQECETKAGSDPFKARGDFEMQDFEICAPSTMLSPHSVHQNGLMSVEHRQVPVSWVRAGAESTRDRIRMEKYQRLDPPLMDTRDF